MTKGAAIVGVTQGAPKTMTAAQIITTSAATSVHVSATAVARAAIATAITSATAGATVAPISIYSVSLSI